MRSMITCAVAALMVVLPLASAQAADGGKDKAAGTKYEAAKGPYAQVGFAVVKTNTGAGDANLGFDLTGGYRFLHWLGADVDFYWAGREQSGGAKTRQFGLTFNGKVYPIGLLAPKTFDAFQPYVVMGMGGGNFKLKDAGAADGKRGTFIFRMGAGLDWLLTENVGLYTDVSLNTTGGFKGPFNSSKGGATGVYTLGAKYIF